MTKQTKGRRKVLWGRLIFVFTVLILCVGLVVGGIGYLYVMWRLDSVKDTHIIVMGIDGSAASGAQRSDSLMVASVMMDKKAVELLSIPRDSYVEIPCYLGGVKDKITHANLGEGESDCVIATVKKLLQLDGKDYYAKIDFLKMITLVDELGGITIKPTASFCEIGMDHKNYCFEKGVTITIDGIQALVYARHRKTDNDLMRAKRQQEILLTMINKLKTMDVWKIYTISSKILKQVDTNLSIVQLAAFYELAKDEEFSINRNTIKGSDAYLYSPGTQAEQYMFKIDQLWLKNYINKIKTPAQ